MKCLDLDVTNGQLKLGGWLYVAVIVYTLFDKEAPFCWKSERGGTILLVIFWEEAPLY